MAHISQQSLNGALPSQSPHITSLPADVLRNIFQIAYRTPPPLNSLSGVVSRTTVALATGPDILTVCSLRTVCRPFKAVVDDCRELRDSIIVALPLRHAPHQIAGANSPDRVWWSGHINRFLGQLEPTQMADIRLCVQAGVEGLSPQRRATMLADLNPLFRRAKAITVHGFDCRPEFSRAVSFSFIVIALPLLERLVLDSCSFSGQGAGNHGLSLAPLMNLLRNVPNIRCLILNNILTAPSEGDPTAAVTMVHLEEFSITGDIRLIPSLLSRLNTLLPLQITVQPIAPSPQIIWADSALSATTYAETATLQLITESAMDILLPVIQNISALHIHETVFTQDLWNHLSLENFPVTTKILLTRCTFTADGVKSLYERIHTAIFFHSPFSHLEVQDCCVDKNETEVLIHWLQDKVERFSWRDAERSVQFTRLITTESLRKTTETARPIYLTADDFMEEVDEAVDWDEQDDEGWDDEETETADEAAEETEVELMLEVVSTAE